MDPGSFLDVVRGVVCAWNFGEDEHGDAYFGK
jgi:hypothetical protein